MTPQDFDDDNEWERIDSQSQDDDYHMVQSDRRKVHEEPNHPEPASHKEHAAASEGSAAQIKSSRSDSPHDEQNTGILQDNSMALVKRTPSESELALAHRSRPSHDRQNHQLATQTISHRSRSPNPTQQPQRSRTPVDFHTRSSRLEEPPRNSGRTGHTYGAVYATGRSTVIMGNIGNVPEGTRSHNYGPVFTADDAKVYFGNATTEEAAKAFQTRDERR